jgi:hypothetical protein
LREVRSQFGGTAGLCGFPSSAFNRPDLVLDVSHLGVIGISLTFTEGLGFEHEAELTGPLLTNPPWFLTGDTPQPTVGDLVKAPR